MSQPPIPEPVPVDLVILSRDDGPLDPRVEGAAVEQRGIALRIHRVVGARRESDHNRWEAICRARNAARTLGDSPLVMFLDDDVVLEPGCVALLAQALDARSEFGALAADYRNECRAANLPRHVAMGATLFRRSALRLIRFRWRPGRCECQCCCDDLRSQGIGITHLPEAKARHLRPEPERRRLPAAHDAAPPRILVAFDRRHLFRFRRQFLATLWNHGNATPVDVVAYGLYPSERAALALVPGVRMLPRPVNGVMPPVRRLRDFQPVLEALPPQTPVAYWDAGDVVFQARLDELWETVRRNPSRLLAVREPRSHPFNAAVQAWTLSVHDPEMRDRAFALLSRNPFLNSGFAAGTARTMLHYFGEADRLLRSRELFGTSDWGDQTALNLYCHSQPERWQEVDQGWNYCLHDRRPGEVRVRPDGIVVGAGRGLIRVVHGNARTLRKLALQRTM